MRPVTPTGWGWRRFPTAALVGAVLVAVLTAPTVTRPTSVGRLDTNDGRFSIWNVAWIAHALSTDPAHVLDANIFWPHRGTLAYSELNLVAGVLGLPWYLATGSPVAALNGAVATGLWLSFVLMWALAGRLTGSDVAGLVSGTAFTFSPFVSARTPHVQLLMVFAFPLALLAFHHLTNRPTPTRGALLGGALAVAAFACGYYGIFAGLAIGFVSVALAQRSRAYWTALAVAVATTALLVYPVFRVYESAREASGAAVLTRTGQAVAYPANLSAYLASGAAAHGWWLPALDAWQPWSEVLFPGIGVLILAAVGLHAARNTHGPPKSRRIALTYLTLVILAAWASFGPQAGLYSVLDAMVPGMSLVRAPSRLGVVVTFGISVLAGYGVASLARRKAWIGPVLVILLACELGVRSDEWGWPSWPLRRVPPLSEAYQRLATLPRGPLVEFPFPYVSSDFHNHARPMFWSTFHWQPLVNGYSDIIPADFAPIVRPINAFPDPVSFRIMQDRQVKYVLWHLDTYSPASRAVLDERMRQYREYFRPLVETFDEWLVEILRYP
jgi:hypothetical protein